MMISLTGRCQPLTSTSWLGCSGGSLLSPGTLTTAGVPGFAGHVHGACHMAGRDLITLQLEDW